jgi:hypothetical protein
MAIVPNDTRFIGINPTVDLRERRSARINRETQPHTMQDITDSIRPYKVFTALVSQAGNYQLNDKTVGDSLTLGVTYLINQNTEDADLTIFGAPNSNVGTYFVCTNAGTLPPIGGISLLWNTGAPVATILENTIGNIWFTFENDGKYYINSNDLFIDYKTFINGASLISGADQPVFNRMIGESAEMSAQRGYFFLKANDSIIRLNTIEDADTFANDIIADSICVEIRVYN